MKPVSTQSMYGGGGVVSDDRYAIKFRDEPLPPPGVITDQEEYDKTINRAAGGNAAAQAALRRHMAGRSAMRR